MARSAALFTPTAFFTSFINHFNWPVYQPVYLTSSIWCFTKPDLLAGVCNSKPTTRNQNLRLETLFPTPLKHNHHRINHNLHIHGEGHVFDVEDVVLEAVDHLIDVFGVAVFDLTP